MEKNIIPKIVKQFLSGRFSDKTEERVQRWLIEDKNTNEKEKSSLDYWDELKAETDANTYSALERVNERIGYSRVKKRIPLYSKIARIAAILIPISILAGGYFYYHSTQNNPIEIRAALGEEKHLFLPDSSEIWLNAGTTIKYSKAFKGEERTVYLDGEAYFSVRKDDSKPFVVNTDFLSVNVLGTQFNVKAYADDDKIITTLTSGTIKVNVEDGHQILKPNEQLSFEKNTSNISLTTIPSGETNGWLSGQLLFTDASFQEIRKTLERKFNTSFDVSGFPISDSKKFTIKFYKNESMDDVLNILQDVIGFNWKKENEAIIIEK